MKDEKILSEEVLDDEELEQVSGGGIRQVCGDNDLMRMLGCQHFGSDIFPGSVENAIKDITKGWAQLGVRLEVPLNNRVKLCTCDNKYYVGGNEISRKDAFTYAMKQRGWNQIAIDCFDWDNVKGAW